MTTNKNKMKNRFGYEWNIYKSIIPIYETQFLLWLPRIKKEDWKEKKFLDVGCGIGRNSFWPLKYGAKSAYLIDVDYRTLDVAKDNLIQFKNCKIEELSIYDLKVESEFDIAFSIGVIHHLDNPKLAVKKMFNSLKANGILAVWVYGYENNEWIVNFFNPIRNIFFKKMPISLVHFLSVFPTCILWILLRLGFGKVEYFNLIRKFNFWHLRSIVFDQMLPNIANYWTKEQVLDLFKDLSLKNIEVKWVNQMSWSVSAIKQ